MLTRFLERLLYEVQPTDGVTFSAVAVFLFGVAPVAAWLPAWRAAGADPRSPLRAE